MGNPKEKIKEDKIIKDIKENKIGAIGLVLAAFVPFFLVWLGSITATLVFVGSLILGYLQLRRKEHWTAYGIIITDLIWLSIYASFLLVKKEVMGALGGMMGGLF